MLTHIVKPTVLLDMTKNSLFKDVFFQVVGLTKIDKKKQ